MKTAHQWASEYGQIILDPDGFGERVEGMPKTVDLMDEKTFHQCMNRSTMHIFDQDLWNQKMKEKDYENYEKDLKEHEELSLEEVEDKYGLKG